MSQVDSSKNPVLFDRLEKGTSVFTASATVVYTESEKGKCTQAVSMQMLVASDATINSSTYTLGLYHNNMLIDTITGTFNVTGSDPLTATVIEIVENVPDAINYSENYSLEITWNATSSATPRLSMLKFPDGKGSASNVSVGIPRDGFAVTASATAFTQTVNGLFVGAAGNVTVTTEGGTNLEFINLTDAYILPGRFTHVISATATNIIGLL